MKFSQHRQAARLSLALPFTMLVVFAGTFIRSVQPPQTTNAILSLQRGRLNAAYGKLPLSFEANQGQADPMVKFLARNTGGGLYLTAQEAILELHGHNADSQSQPTLLRLKLRNANPVSQVTGEDELPGRSHYLIGHDQTKWRRNIANYAKVRYHNVYPGIDLVYYGNQQRLEYDFVLAPGAEPRAIKLKFDEARRVELDANGDLLVQTAAGELRQLKPLIYQESKGERHLIAGGYKLTNEGEVAFELGVYDGSLPLVIDPVLNYLARTNVAEDLAVDAQGNAYITASAFSGSFTFVRGVTDVNVMKLDPTGTQQLANVVIGGSDTETPKAIAVDAAGSVYVTGSTSSTDFPVGWPVTAPGTGAGLCFKSTDSATNWNPSGRGLASTGTIEKLLVDPNQPSTLYVGAGALFSAPGKLYKSVDGGANWAVLDSVSEGMRARLLALVPTNPTTIYISIESRLLKSTDGGATWTDTGLSVSGLRWLEAVQRTPSSLYAATETALYRSTDSGRTWTQTSVPGEVFITQLAVDPTNASTLLLAGRRGGAPVRIYKSTDSGANWSLLDNDFADRDVLSLVFDPAGTAVYAGTFRGLFKSQDGGRSWQSAGLNNFRINLLAVDPLAPTRLYASTTVETIESPTGTIERPVGGVQRSLDGGLSWSQFNNRMKGRFALGLALNPQNPSTLYLTTGNYLEAFVLKLLLKPNDVEIGYAVYCGAGVGTAIAVDGSGNTYLAGQSNGPDATLPVAKVGLALPDKPDTAFVAKLDAQGRNFLYLSTFGGGLPNDLAVDGTGKIYVAGTSGGALTLKNALPLVHDSLDAFVSKFDPEQSGADSLLYSTYLGRPGATDFGNGLAVLPDGKVYVTGDADQINDTEVTYKLGQENGNIFLAKLDTTKTGTAALLWSALLGVGSGSKVAADAAGNAYVAGSATATFPVTPGALQTSFAGGTCGPATCSCPLMLGFCPARCLFFLPQHCTDAFVAKVNPEGTALLYSTFLGSDASANEQARSIVLDSASNVYLSGIGNLPVTTGAFNSSGFNGFISKLTLGTRNTNVVTLSAANYRGPELARSSLAASFLEAAGEWARNMTVRVKDSTGAEHGAVMLYSGDGQVNFQIPTLAATGAARVQVLSGNAVIAAGAIQIVEVAPGIFTTDGSGRGLTTGVIQRRYADGTFVYEPIVQFDPAQKRFVAVPIDLGPEGDQVYLALFGTGFRGRSAQQNVSLKIGGVDVEVTYADLQPTLIGVDQINARLPRSLAGRGEVDVVLTVDGKTANTVRVSIK